MSSSTAVRRLAAVYKFALAKNNHEEPPPLEVHEVLTRVRFPKCRISAGRPTVPPQMLGPRPCRRSGAARAAAAAAPPSGRPRPGEVIVMREARAHTRPSRHAASCRHAILSRSISIHCTALHCTALHCTKEWYGKVPSLSLYEGNIYTERERGSGRGRGARRQGGKGGDPSAANSSATTSCAFSLASSALVCGRGFSSFPPGPRSRNREIRCCFIVDVFSNIDS